jgi:hypothetical protein
MGYTRKEQRYLKRMMKVFECTVKQQPFYKKNIKAQYRSPSGYSDYQLSVLNLAKMFLLTTDPHSFPGSLDLEWRIKFLQSNLFLEFEKVTPESMYPYWLSPDLTQGFMNTRTPKDFYLRTNELAGIIFFPTSHAIKYEANNKSPLIVDSFYYRLNEKYLSVACYVDDSMVTYTFKRNNIAKALRNVDPELENLTDEAERKEIEFGLQLANLGMQTLLYVENYEPELLPDTSQNNLMFLPRFTSPIVGKNYRIKTEGDITHNCANKTTEHHNKSTHWRSGHWRNQLHGGRDNPQYKIIWIEPMLINANKLIEAQSRAFVPVAN